MRLRVLALALVLFALPISAEAQPAAKAYRVGILDNEASMDVPRLKAFRQELRHLGWVEGQNLIIESRIGPEEDFPALAVQLVRLGVDLVFAPKTSAVQAAKSATKRIPIVFAVAGDPVASGFIVTLGRPGGNITGLSSILGDLGAKQLDLLRTAVPGMTRVAVLLNPRLPYSAGLVLELETAAQLSALQLQLVKWEAPGGLDSAFVAINKARADALLVLPNPMQVPYRTRLADLAMRHRLPSIGIARENAEAGALMSYGPNQVDLYRRAAVYVDKILRGAKPADLPVEQPTMFELVVNMKTAKVLGLTIPPALLLRADRIIE